MTISIVTQPYELLIRFRADGSLAAQLQHIERTLSGGAVANERVLDPVAVSTDGIELEALVTAVLAQALPADPAPTPLTAVQLHLALARTGLADDVDAWLATQDQEVVIRFERATSFDPADPLFEAARAALNISQGDFDALIAAARAT